MIITFPKCNDSRECFAKNRFRDCTILRSCPKDGACTFCKADKEVTKGRRYPANKKYDQSH